jgi:hypothetical protein
MSGITVHLGSTAVSWLCLLLAVTTIAVAFELAVTAVLTGNDSAPASVATLAPSDHKVEQCDMSARIPVDVLVGMTMDELL